MKSTRPRKPFEDSTSTSFFISSSWKQAQLSRPRKSTECQTSPELFVLDEREVQSGRYARIVQDEISHQESSITLLDHMCTKHTKLWDISEELLREKWRDKIEDGFVTIDCEVSTDPTVRLCNDEFVEFVDVYAHVATQTEWNPSLIALCAPLIAMAEPKESRSEAKESKTDAKRDRNQRHILQDFINKVSPFVFEALTENITSTVFHSVIQPEVSRTEGISLTTWCSLSVDLEKKRVVFPDWTKASHLLGTITRCTLTRNKERVYDVDFEDGGRLHSVREEHIRLLDAPRRSSDTKAISLQRLQEGVRVHALLNSRGAKYYPGRVVRIGRNTVDVEIEGSRIEAGLSVDDLVIGLLEGQRIEARKPRTVLLQATALHWNATGNTIAVCFGKQDMSGWNNQPGALCVWNIFGKNFDGTNPDMVLDHSVGLSAVAFHPILPSLVAATSLNGEILVWDLAAPEPLVALSPMGEYSHKDAVVSVQWIFGGQVGSDSWWLLTVGVDGKLLFWTLANKLQHPLKGFVLLKNKNSRRTGMQNSHGASSLALSCGSYSTKQLKPKWVVIGQQGGAIVKAQLSKLTGTPLNAEMLKSNPAVEDVFSPFQRSDDGIAFSPHVGVVSSVDWSPFHRHLFISAGSDGIIKLCHVLEQEELRRWEPLSFFSDNSDGIGVAVTAVKFSPVRPLLFGVTLTNGFLMLFDLEDTTNRPVVFMQPEFSKEIDEGRGKDIKKSKSTKVRGIPLTNLAFNHKQRDLVAATDWNGRVFIWKMSWSLSAMKPHEQEFLNRIGDLSTENDEL